MFSSFFCTNPKKIDYVENYFSILLNSSASNSFVVRKRLNIIAEHCRRFGKG